MTDPLPLSIFISYSHDSDEHRERVLGLSERLRADGIETILDRYVESGSPPEGWSRWMLNALDKATHVVCVCTETYYRRFRGREVPGKGKGVDWEGALMTQSLYDARSVSTKFIPVLFARTDEPCVPEPLRGQTYYVMDSDASYEALYDALLNQNAVVPGPVGTPKRKPRATGQPLSFPSVPPAAEAKSKIFDDTRKIAGTQLEKHAPRVLFGRETELAALNAAWANGTLNVYTLVAWGGAGKTSLVFHWVQTRFAAKGWPDVERYFDWSFYSQGTGESRQTSADLFIAKALAFFGDPDPTVGGPYERGERLAGLIRQHRTLLILDGIEPLQYPPNDPQAGRLKDQALDALLGELATDNPGLVVITSREHLTNVEGQATTEEQKLDKMSSEAGVALLRHLQIVGTDEELHAAWKDAGGHALTLSLLGRFIADAYDDRDIRHYREVKFEAADQEHQGRSAFKVVVAYERWLHSGGPDRQRELAVLRLTGLFDRPMAKRCLQALRAEPAIPGLTDTLVKLTQPQWNIAVKRLSEVELLSVSADAIDAHPLIREYFAAQLKRDQPEAFQAAHSRLFDYLCENTPHRPDGIDGLAPLYEAVTHGGLAGRHQEACDKVYRDRILRGTGSDGFYSTNKLGAIGADLAAVAAFFDQPWRQVSPNLTAADQAWLLNQAAFSLRALGRLTEALQPMRAALEMSVRLKDWKSAAIYSGNLSELELTLGWLPDAVTDARQSITHADQSGDASQRMARRTTAADALHQSGQRMEAGTLFAEAERMQQEYQPQFDLLYSLPGFRYCDWLLADLHRLAWFLTMEGTAKTNGWQSPQAEAEWRAVYERATRIRGLSRENGGGSLLEQALNELAVGRAVMIEALVKHASLNQALSPIEAAVSGLRSAGQQQYLVQGLLSRSWVRFLSGHRSGAESAQHDLDEAWDIAARGPMPLAMADIMLFRVRLFGLSEWKSSLKDEWRQYPWREVELDLSESRCLIERHGYGRRLPELEDAEEFYSTPSSHRKANKFEAAARQLLKHGDLDEAWTNLFNAIREDSSRKHRIVREFSFAFSFDGELEASQAIIKQDTEALAWRRRIWSTLALGSELILERASDMGNVDDVNGTEDVSKTDTLETVRTTPSVSSHSTPEEKGELLEQAVSRLFGSFFEVGDETPWKIRTQKRGTQSGHDLGIEWSGKCAAAFDQRLRVHVECKNYSNGISHNEVGGKLLVEGIADPPVIEHWILISPNTDATNELNRFLESQQRNPTYPFDIQIWSPETGVHEFFGLEPDVFDLFYTPLNGEQHPRTWDETKRKAVREKWMARLARPLRLPPGWTDYLRNPAKLCTLPEDSKKFMEADASYVPLRCRNSAGALLEKPSASQVREWLENPDKQSLFLLGEFGDGKTCFTYVLARQLAESWLEHQQGWIPLRMTLKSYPGNARQFLEQRLREFNADVSGWSELERHAKRLVILDGFDEMSVKVGPVAVTKNIGDLLACVKEFKGCKVLITSRTHFFDNSTDAQRLMVRLGNPTIYQLARIERKQAYQSTLQHLEREVGALEAKKRISQVVVMDDPIGMAQKPLFLEMLKAVLSRPQMPDDMSIYDLYETYITDTLERNEDRLDDGDLLSNPTETIPNMRRILGEVAEELQRSGKGFISISQFQSQRGEPLAQLLWRLTGGEDMDKDAQRRVGSRSLLTRVELDDDSGVDFCHRSMREYFVAIRLCEAVEASADKGQTFLREVPLSNEIIDFAAERWKRRGFTVDASNLLLKLIEDAKHANDPGAIGGYSLTLLYRLNPKLPRDRDWRWKEFDGADIEDADLSGMDFQGSSFVSANLANVNFENANFKDCNLTGVRLEETKAIQSLSASPSGSELLAVYADGVLREWRLKSGSKVNSTTVHNLSANAEAFVGVHETGQMWYHLRGEWTFLSRNTQPWNEEGVFAVDANYRHVSWVSNRLFSARTITGDRMQLTLLDLETEQVIGQKQVHRAQWSNALGEEAFVWSDAASLRIAPIASSNVNDELVLRLPSEPMCLGVRRCDLACFLVGTGTNDGQVIVWRLERNLEKWSAEKLLDAKAHQGAVTAIAFLDESRLATGGIDRAVVLSTLIGQDNLDGTNVGRLERSLRCRGMKVEGVQSPIEFGLLQKFIENCGDDSV
jgi:hypothetical protein